MKTQLITLAVLSLFCKVFAVAAAVDRSEAADPSIVALIQDYFDPSTASDDGEAGGATPGTSTSSVGSSPAPKVSLDYATVTGAVSQPYSDGVSVNFFLGIPFVEKPARFQPPKPISGSLGDIQATQFKPSCPQVDGTTGTAIGDEDCLYLNIWTPAYAKKGSNLPVMVYVYGGTFIAGNTTNPRYNGANIVYEAQKLYQDVIVVTFNYRVQAFGFLASPEIKAVGGLNAGLLDQKAAFLWVRKYIASFGGNPKKVTAFGQSAGAISIGLHMVAKHKDGFKLFDQAIQESGGAQPGPIFNWQQSYGSLYQAIANSTKCTTFKCIQDLPAAQLALAGAQANSKGVPFQPVVEEGYIPKVPVWSWLEGQFAKVPLIIGGNTNEGTKFVKTVKTKEDAEAFMSRYLKMAPKVVSTIALKIYDSKNYESTSFGAPAGPFFAAAAFFGDMIFDCSVLFQATAHSASLQLSSIAEKFGLGGGSADAGSGDDSEDSEGDEESKSKSKKSKKAGKKAKKDKKEKKTAKDEEGSEEQEEGKEDSDSDDKSSSSISVYKYRFDNKPTLDGAPPVWGVDHGAEVNLVFPDFKAIPKDDASHLGLAEIMVGYWTRFAYSGNPNKISADAISKNKKNQEAKGRKAGKTSLKKNKKGKKAKGTKKDIFQWPAYVAGLPYGQSQQLVIQSGAPDGLVLETDNKKLKQCAFWGGIFLDSPALQSPKAGAKKAAKKATKKASSE